MVFKISNPDSVGVNNSFFKEFRTLVVDIVLATDMSQHFQQMSQINDALNNPKELDKVKVMALIVHLADISHAAKSWDLHER